MRSHGIGCSKELFEFDQAIILVHHLLNITVELVAKVNLELQNDKLAALSFRPLLYLFQSKLCWYISRGHIQVAQLNVVGWAFGNI